MIGYHSLNEDVLPLPKQPKRVPDEIGDLSDICSEVLCQQMAEWAGWAAYVESVLSDLDKHVLTLQLRYDIAFGAAMSNMRKEHGKISLTELKALALGEEEVNKLNVTLLEQRARYAKLKSLVQGYDRKYNCLSRELSRRMNEANKLRH